MKINKENFQKVVATINKGYGEIPWRMPVDVSLDIHPFQSYIGFDRGRFVFSRNGFLIVYNRTTNHFTVALKGLNAAF